MTHIKVDGNENLIRDENTNAVLNVNMNEYRKYLQSKKVKEDEVSRIKNLENDLINMKSDLDEIKTLLRSLANGSK